MQEGRRLLGYVLSGSTTSSFNFIVVEDAEDDVAEGQYVIVDPEGAQPIIGVVEELSYFHEFYEEGDVWTEAIRKKSKPPATVARQYMKGKVSIIGVPRDGQVVPPGRPPRAGAEVKSVLGRDLAPVFSHDPSDPSVPEHLLPVGSLYGYPGGELKAFLDLRSITMHMAVIGTTGSGKTNTVSVLIEELGGKKGVDTGIAKLPITIPMIIIDINADYIPYYENPDNVPSYTMVYRLVSKTSRAWKERARHGPRAELRPILLDLNVFDHNELAELIVSLYKGKPDESTVLQESYLRYKLNKEVLKKEAVLVGGDYNELFRSRSVFDALLRSIDRDASREGGYPVYRATAEAVKRQLEKFYNLLHEYELIPQYSEEDLVLGREFIDEVTDPSRPSLVIVDLSVDGFPGHLEAKQFVVFYLSKLLYNMFVEYRSRARGEEDRRVLVFAMEEAQNFVPNLAQYSIGASLSRRELMTIATQGRKFGLSLLLITQRPIYVDPVVMSMMNTFIIHRVPAFDVKFVQQVTGGLPKAISKGLTTMEKGRAIIVGQMNPNPHPTIVKVRRRRPPPK